jgi:hypothetical protein
LILTSFGHLETKNEEINIYGGELQFSSGSEINAGESNILFEETCVTTASISIGGSTEEAARMSLSHAELGSLSGTNITWKSTKGDIYCNTFVQSSHMQEVNGTLFLNAPAGLVMVKGSFTASSIDIFSQNGLTLEADLTSSEGSLELTFNGPMVMDKFAHLTAQTDLLLTSDDNIISVTTPITIESKTKDLILSHVLSVNRGDTSDDIFLLTTPLSIICRSLIQFTNEGTGNMQLISASVDLTHDDCNINADYITDEIYLHATCHGENCSMDFGAFSSPSEWHLNQEGI